jgi:hypothetical protein
MESRMEVPQKLKKQINISTSDTSKRMLSQDTVSILAHPCLLKHYSQQPNHGNSPDAL